MLSRDLGERKLAGVLGWPLEHTVSPEMHNAVFRELGIDAVYLALPVRPEELRDAVEGLRALGALGANVTMPHKEEITPLLDELAPTASALGAVNTIELLGERAIGHNTDVEGLRDFCLRDASIDARAVHALVLGAGGAARAAVTALAELGATEVVVAARRRERAQEVAALGGRGAGVGWNEAAAEAARADIVVNATPLGARGDDALPDASFRPDQVVIDLVYRPAVTVLVTRARAAGARSWGGLGMLARQGAASFRIWTGREAPVEVMAAAARHALGGQDQGCGGNSAIS